MVQPSGTFPIGAQVVNDAANAGVNWSCVPVGTCGSFSQTPSASGAMVSYTAPATAPTTGKITITAASVTDNTMQASATFAIFGVGSTANLRGQYSFFLTAPNGNRGSTSLLGSVTLDGNGNVTGGVQDLISPAITDLQDQILATCTNPTPSASTYQIDSTGHGFLKICTANGQQTNLSFVLTSSSHALIIEIDNSAASGSLDLQNPAAGGFAASQIFGGYSFTMTGTNPANPMSKLSFGGNFTADGAGNLSGGQLDVNTDGVFSTTPSITGAIAAPDLNGRGTLSFFTIGRTFIYYIISPQALRLAEADSVDLMGGTAFAQGLPSFAPFNGPYIYQHSGWVQGGRAVAVGQFAVNASGKFNAGVSDATVAGSPITANTGIHVQVTYAYSGNQIGKLTLNDAAGASTFNFYSIDPSINAFDPNNSSVGVGGFLLLHTDANINGTGILLPQTVTSYYLLGNQVLNLTNLVNTTGTANELDLVGLAFGDGKQYLTPATVDYNQNSTNPDPILGTPFIGDFLTDINNAGRYTGIIELYSLTDYPFVPPAPSTFNLSFYQISDSQSFVLENDGLAIVSGIVQQQALP